MDWGDWQTWGTAAQAKAYGGVTVLDNYKPRIQRKGWNSVVLNPQGGPGTSYVPMMVDTSGALKGKTIVAIADDGNAPTEYRFKLALCSDGTLVGWGVLDTLHPPVTPISLPNGPRPISDGHHVNPPVCLLPVQVNTVALAGHKIIAIAAGDGSVMALTQDGLVYEWGLHSGWPVISVAPDEATTQKLSAMFLSRGRLLDHFNPKHPEGISTLLADDDIDTTAARNTPNRLPLERGLIEDDPVWVNFGAMKNRKAKAISYDNLTGDAVVLCTDGTVVSWGSVWQFFDGSVVTGTLGLGMPTALNERGLLSQKIVVAVAGHTALCSDGSLVRWPSAINGEITAKALRDPDGLLKDRKVVKITPGFALCSDGTLLSWNLRRGNSLTTGTSEPHDLTGLWGIDDVLIRYDDPLLKGKAVADVAGDPDNFVIRCADGTLLRNPAYEKWVWTETASRRVLRVLFAIPDHFPAEPVDAAGIPKDKAVIAISPQMILFGDKTAK
ncbi:MAG TPA: hypothetical protein VHC95_11445 [Opitutales bacterium]|nr:hypothetical protein [Opitutales bacterium]